MNKYFNLQMKLIIQPRQDSDISDEFFHHWQQLAATNRERIERGDAGVDLIMPKTVVFPPRETTLVSFCIKCQPKAVDNEKKQGYDLVMRSSLAKTPLRLANCIGIIDWGYRGEIMAMFDNTSTEEFTLEQGKRPCQLVAPDRATIEVDIGVVESSERSEGGFGSTGGGATADV